MPESTGAAVGVTFRAEAGAGDAGVGVSVDVGVAEAEATALLAQLLPFPADGESHVRQQVLERAGGGPLFLVSCVQALSTGSLTWNGASHVPWTLREAILQRVVALEGTAQQVLRVAAVVGRRVPRAYWHQLKEGSI